MAERRFFLPSDDPHDPRGRLAVYVSTPDSPLGEGLIDIADEECTSERTADAAQAVQTATSALCRLCLTTRQATWLRDVLNGLNLGEGDAPVREAP